MATLEVINVGSTANDGTGDPLRVAFEKVNNNFANLWSTGYNTQESITSGNSTQLIFEWPANLFTQGSFEINSVISNSSDSQNILLKASINNDLDEVKFVGYGTTFHGNAVTNFSMNIVDENVQLYAEPLTTEQVSHFIIYQVTYSGLLMGTPLSLENNPNTALSTENTNSIITSEG
mgnify:CR=1 FL=1